MALMYWWAIPLSIVCLAVLLLLLWLKKRKSQSPVREKLALANCYRLIRIPGYRTALRKYGLLLTGVLISLCVAILAGMILTARPIDIQVVEPTARNRDIILCLDVSGSMVRADAEITSIYADLAQEFDGERIGLVVFDSSPVTIFPLTNDYEYLTKQLKEVSKVFSKYADGSTMNSDDDTQALYREIFSGVNEGGGSSLIGDGLASCVNRFDRLDSKRSRSIIFGTDNYLAGSPIVTLIEASEIAVDKEIRVYGVNPADYSYGDRMSREVEEFKKAMLTTGGDYYKIDDASAVSSIISKISAQEATRFKGSPQLAQTDRPQFIIYTLIGVTLVILVGLWRIGG